MRSGTLLADLMRAARAQVDAVDDVCVHTQFVCTLGHLHTCVSFLAAYPPLLCAVPFTAAGGTLAR